MKLSSFYINSVTDRIRSPGGRFLLREGYGQLATENEMSRQPRV